MKLKREILGSLLLLGLVCVKNVTAQTNETFILEGEISGLKNPTKLYLCAHPGTDTVARTIARGSNFSFSGKVNGANCYFIKMDTLVSKKPSKAIWLMSKKIRVQTNLTTWPEVTVTGSEAQQDYNNILRLAKEAKEKGDDVNMVYKEFIKKHSNSLYVPHLILKCESILGTEGLKEAYENLTLDAKNSHFGLALKKEVEQLKYLTQLKPGGILPDFKLSTTDGKVMSVLEYAKKGRLTLIDFWASWCKPCRAETPNMKKVYEAFHDQGFNIIGVSTDKKETDWKKALAEDKTYWFHGRDNLENAFKGIFAIGSIPAFALVDGDGKMIAFSCSSSTIPSFGPEIRGEGLYKTIEELLTKK
jgi:thiol-disulfide isomerase/thioredoxin